MKRRMWLDTFLPPFVETEREKPRDMLYIAQETPPPSTILMAGIQHTLVALMLVVYLVIVGQDIGLAGGQLRGFISLGVVVMGIGTLLNSLTTRVSAGHLLVHIPSPITMTVFILVVMTFGLSAAAGGMLVAGFIVFFMGRFLPRLQVLFPPEVTGVLLVLLGVCLLPGGVRRFIGLEEGVTFFNMGSVLIALCTLGTITAISVWSSGRVRVFALIIGVAIGLLAAVLTGHFGTAELTAVAGQPLFAMPFSDYRPPVPTWVPGAIIPLALTLIISAVDEVGCGVMVDRMNNNQWRRPDLPMIGRLLNIMGICNVLSGLTGTLTTGSSSANLGLAHATGVAARRVGTAAGLMLIAIACLPKISLFITLLPRAVIGAILVYTAAYMMVSGTELILSRLLNSRRRATVGLSLAAGMAVLMVPELTATMPLEIKPILGSGLVVGVVSAIVLNLIFRIGVSRRGEILLDGQRPTLQAARFLEERGADWGARRDVIGHAGIAVGEALETLQGAGLLQGSARLMAVFDEYKLIVTLDYPGRGIRLAEERAVDLQALLDEEHDDAALDEAMAVVSAGMIRNMADQVECSERKGRGRIRLIFNH
ncbi:MAG: purine/pyrimidine permease [Proteobacteria bacterium]|nr:purine/pyrimidine permease [Pseudomonadota bacterium]